MDRGHGTTKRPFRQRCKPLHGFTIIELLVVISIIALLVALLLPGLSKARHMAKDVVCGSNLHQVSVGLYAYSSDFHDYLPHNIVEGDWLAIKERAIGGDWQRAWPRHYAGLGKLYGLKYLEDARTLWCGNEDMPTQKAGSENGAYGYRKLMTVDSPDEIRTDYWYRGGRRMKLSKDHPPAERVSQITPPKDGVVMCGGWKPSNPSLEIYVNWNELHQARGFNLLMINGAVGWYNYNNKPLPSVWGDSGTMRYRPDFPKETLELASQYYHTY